MFIVRRKRVPAAGQLGKQSPQFIVPGCRNQKPYKAVPPVKGGDQRKSVIALQNKLEKSNSLGVDPDIEVAKLLLLAGWRFRH
jgi:hypothetical protein